MGRDYHTPEAKETNKERTPSSPLPYCDGADSGLRDPVPSTLTQTGNHGVHRERDNDKRLMQMKLLRRSLGMD